MKYVIEFENEPAYEEDGQKFHRCRQAAWWTASGLLISRLAPLDKELDRTYQKGFSDGITGIKGCIDDAYQNGFDGAWTVITKIAGMPPGMKMAVFGDVWLSNIISRYSASEIVAMLEKHESEKEEIGVGDEVMSVDTGGTYIIHETDDGEAKGYNFQDGTVCCDHARLFNT